MIATRPQPLAFAIALTVSGALSGLASDTQAQDDWRLSAYNRLQADHYDVGGNPAAAPYPDTGGYAYDQFSLNGERRLSPYQRINLSLSGLINDSPYRSPYEGLTVERARAFWENGNAAVPVRLEGGDIYAFHTTRTLQSALKGAQTELQPRLGGGRHSVQLFAGQQAPTYRELDDDGARFAGGSWLWETDRLGALAFNYHHGWQQTGTEREQDVLSLAHAIDGQWAGQRLNLESEIAYLEGDSATGTARDDATAVHLALRGNSLDAPVRYESRFSEYGEHYQPLAAGVGADQRSWENSLTWRGQGTFVRGRYYYYRTGVASSNPVDNHTVGGTVGGSIGQRVYGNIDAFVSQQQDNLGNIDSHQGNLSASLSAPLGNNLNGRLSGLWQQRDDHIAGGVDSQTHQLTAAVDYDLQWGAFSGTLSPGVTVRSRDSDSTQTTDWQPQFQAALSGNGHSLRLAHNTLWQDSEAPNDRQLRTQQTSLQYSYQLRQHRLGIEGRYYDRAPEDDRNSYASQVSLYWEYRFEQSPLGAPATGAGITAAGAVSLTRFNPGTPIDRVTEALANLGLGQPNREDGLLIYETPVLEDIQQRQRLVYAFTGASVQSSNLVIDFGQIGDGRSARRVFQRVLATLLEEYGTPTQQLERGDFGPNLAPALAANQFIRAYQWQVDGHTLRFGIPARTDGQVRMELRYGAELTPLQQNDWSLERLR